MTVGAVVSITISCVARPSVPVAGNVSTAALPARSLIVPPPSASAAVEA